jgi:hypothetical protein
MNERYLHVINHAYRATLEEQDDPILWLVQAMRGAGSEGAVLLCGTAVSYGVAGQDASGLAFGARRQTQPPRLGEDLERMQAAGTPIYYVNEDAAQRGIDPRRLVAGLISVDREKVPDLLDGYGRVFAW